MLVRAQRGRSRKRHSLKRKTLKSRTYWSRFGSGAGADSESFQHCKAEKERMDEIVVLGSIDKIADSIIVNLLHNV